MRIRNTIRLLCVSLALAFGWLASGDQASTASSIASGGNSLQAQVDFEREIRPLLHARCLECHGADKQQSGLRLDSKAAAMKGGVGGVVIVPGKGSASGPGFRLYRYLEDNVATFVPLDQHGPETFRRAVYHQNARSSLLDGLTDFDLPDNASAAPSRIHTTSPLQALTMLNHSFTLVLADALVERVKREAHQSNLAQVRRAFALAFQRLPAADEDRAASALIAEYGWRAFARALLNANELLYVN
jgi:hypothetical protein